MNVGKKRFFFLKNYADLTGVLTDKELASLGDAFINFVYSLALSERRHQPSGAKVKGRTLAEAFRKSELRGYMPSRVTRHMLADAAEALVVYGWLCDCITLQECVAILAEREDLIEGIGRLLLTVKESVRF